MIQFAVIAHILGVLLSIFSITMLPPILVGIIFQENNIDSFLWSFAITLIGGLILWLPFAKNKNELRIRDGFLITSLFWIVLSIFGSLPLLLSNAIDLSVTDAMFESMSGLTTTGATVVVGLDELPKSILYYRQQLQWLGGIGIIVIAVAILPMLGVGGMQLYRAETPGPLKDSKLTPRITGTAKALSTIYLTLTLACMIAYWAAGMSWFDAICHAYSTIAIGGFSTHDSSIGFFDSKTIMIICCAGMLLSSINYALHFYAWQLRKLSHYFRDPETKFYLTIVVISIVLTCSYLSLSDYYNVSDSAFHGVFQTISVITTTGFTTTDFSVWPTFLPLLLMMIALMGGCAGSTAGGLKAVRVMLVVKQGLRELRQTVHPNAIIPLKVGNHRVAASVVSAVWSFAAVYVITFMILVLLLTATGLDIVTAFSAVVGCLNNLGPGLGDVAGNYAGIPNVAKWILSVAMLLGRLEIFTLLILFSPTFWRA